MFNLIARKIFGTRNERLIKRMQPRVAAINALEPQVAVLNDEQLAAKTVEFKKRLSEGATLDDLLPEAFAVVRETAKRLLGERHYDVQLLGGIVLHEGKIPEMRTGEGKTLVATAPVYLNALTGKGVHVVTVNDYLASRDAEWMGQIYRFLGLSVGCIQTGMDENERRAAYACDITYSTNNELGFDYLRDNMKYQMSEMVHRPFNYAIIDEVDSILIDEARTPLIISGAAEDTTDLYVRVDKVIVELIKQGKAEDRLYALEIRNNKAAPLDAPPDAAGRVANGFLELDEKNRTVLPSEHGVERIEQLLKEAGLLEDGGLYDTHNMSVLHHVNKALLAQLIQKRDVDYIVKDNKVVIIDSFTGRMMPGRRFGDGLHQALEAKENVTVQRETQTLASVTFQNFFRMYPKIAGMTGTAMTEAGEFGEIYNLEVIEIPTHRDVSRKDANDEIYRTAAEKNRAIVKLVKEAHQKQQPVLVGTTSIEKSEQLSDLFKKEKIPHSVLNARHHEQEAAIVAQAGRPGMVTVATNMAGRGTDIKLGGSADLMLKTQLKGDETPQEIEAKRAVLRAQVEKDKEVVMNAGGLLVIGTERHESRRIDNQLRGRSGRQGDPGASHFYISLEDDLMRIFGAERIDAVLVKLGIKEGHAIYHPWINTAIERAQKKIEGQNFDARRHLLRFDNVMNDQRKVIYQQRRDLMQHENLGDLVAEIIEDVVLLIAEQAIPAGSYKEQWQIEQLQNDLQRLTGQLFPVAEWASEEGIGETEFADRILNAVNAHWQAKKAMFVKSIEEHPEVFGLGADTPMAMRGNFATTLLEDMERNVVLQMLDKSWKEHLLNLDHLRQGINLRGYAQRDPLNEYKAEAFTLFRTMLEDYRYAVAQTLLSLAITASEDLALLNKPSAPQEMQTTRVDPAMAGQQDADFPAANVPLRAVPVVKQKFNKDDPNTWANMPRNELCPCGSGKKYKHCHGALGAVAVRK
jgi:preprotein translocase subunit SecA